MDQHNYEHQVYILSGQGFLRGGELTSPVLRELHNGDTVFVPSNAVHQFINERDEPLVFLCVKGNPKLYDPDPESAAESSMTGYSERNFY